MSDEIVLIDARVLGFEDRPSRILSACFKYTGEILVKKQADFSVLPAAKNSRQETVIVTDTPEVVQDWHLSFDAKADLQNVINIYQMQRRAGLVRIEDSVSRYDPRNILEVRKVDKNGILQEFDTTSLTNGHIAVLLSVWASYQIMMNYQSLMPSDFDNVDTTLLPQSLSL